MPENSQLATTAGTFFAPAGRATSEQLTTLRQQLLGNPLVISLMNAIPDPVMVLNRQRQIVAANDRLVSAMGERTDEALIGLRPGELVQCVNAADAPGGCGTGENCSVCGAIHAILDCVEEGDHSRRECRIRTRDTGDGGAMELDVETSLLDIGQSEVIVFAMRDVSAEKRRNVLERTFFHDVLNVVMGLQAVTELLDYAEDDPETAEEYRRDLRRMSSQIGDEIMSHRQLLAAERGHLVPNKQPVLISEILESVVELYRHHTVARGRTIEASAAQAGELETDPVLLRRVIGNLVKNALEAIPEGATVTVEGELQDGQAVFRVRNPGVIPEAVQKQIFQRSFSTKGTPGRGIGTHSVRLLTENCLGGKVWFDSRAPEGTVFTVVIPAGDGAASTAVSSLATVQEVPA